jgi:sirohydrochlorin ferrochelatase
MDDARFGIIVLAHGSQRGFSKQECSCTLVPNGDNFSDDAIALWCRDCPDTAKGVNLLCSMIQNNIGEDKAVVINSFLEFLEPNPYQSIKKLIDKGLKKIVIFPFLLGNGKHATLELDELLEELRNDNPTVEIDITNGMGADPRLAEMITERAKVILTNDNRYEGKDGVIIVKAGTKTEYDDCLWLGDLSDLVQDKLGESINTTYAQSHYGLPEMDERTSYIINEGGVHNVTFVPYLFFPGLILQRNIMGTIKKYQIKFPHVKFNLAPPLGITEILGDIAVDRVLSALGSKQD